MLHSVALVRTDVSEERIASIIRVTRIGELGMKIVCFNKSMSSETENFEDQEEGNCSERKVKDLEQAVKEKSGCKI
jgi:hypothetical protein